MTTLKHADMLRLVQSIPEVIEWHTVTGNYAILLKMIEQLEESGETNTSLILDQNAEQKIIGK